MVNRNRSKPRTSARSAIAATAIIQAPAVREERTMALVVGAVTLVGSALALIALHPVLGATTGLVAFAIGFVVIGVVARRQRSHR